MFRPCQFVIVNDSEIGAKEELGSIVRLVPWTAGQGYEITLLCDHKPRKGVDPVRCVGGNAMSLATKREIRTAVKDWEDAHNHKLCFDIIPSGKGFAFA